MRAIRPSSIASLVVAAAVVTAGCASMFDKPHVVAHETEGKDGLVAWSSGSAAAVGMSATNGALYYCVQSAAFARTGTTSGDANVSLVGKSFGFGTTGSAGALLIKNEGQTATYLDTGLFQLCMMFAQQLIKDQDQRVDLIKTLITTSVEIAKADQFATTAALQPVMPPAAAQPSDAASAAAAAAKSASAAATSASAASGAAAAAANSASAAASVVAAVSKPASGAASSASAVTGDTLEKMLLTNPGLFRQYILSGKVPKPGPSDRTSQKEERDRLNSRNQRE